MGALFEGINWWAVVVAVIAFQGLGAAWYGILAKPWMAAVAPSRSRFKCLAAWAMVYTKPRPVACRRPWLPPNSMGLPVTTPGVAWPWV